MQRKTVIILLSFFFAGLLVGVILGVTPGRGLTVISHSDYPWSSYRRHGRNTGFSEGPAPDTNQTAWRSFEAYGDVGNVPTVAYGMVFTLEDRGNLYVLNETDGTTIWTKWIRAWRSSPTIAYDKIFIGRLGGSVCALNKNTGDIVWEYQIYGYGQPLFTPQVADDRVFFNNRDGWLFCLNATTGEFIWKYETGLSDTYQAVADGRVFTGTYCLKETDGTLIWKYNVERDVAGSVAPIVENGRVFFGLGSAIHCVDEFTGLLKWKYETGGILYFYNPAVAYGKVFVSSNDGYVYSLNEENGTLLWKHHAGDVSSPSVADGKVFLSSDQTLICLNASTGSLVGSILLHIG